VGKMASPPEEKEKWVCPIGECQESAVHPLVDCKGFGNLSVTKRRKMLKERSLRVLPHKLQGQGDWG
jgi:hypothetical protein